MAETEHGRITDEGIAKLRARIGQGFPGRRPWRTEVTRDAIYHLALAIGDLSPLYLDEDYARGKRWGTLIAPPIIMRASISLTEGISADSKNFVEVMKNPFETNHGSRAASPSSSRSWKR